MALSVLVGTGAWACVPQPLLSLQPRASGAAGTQVTVEGLFIPGPVEIRWNGVDGPRLATADGPHFSVPVTIPQASEGLYTLMVITRGADGSVGTSGRIAFLVTGAETDAAKATSASTPKASADNRSSTSVPLVLAEGAAIALVGGAGGMALSSRRQRRPRADAGPARPD